MSTLKQLFPFSFKTDDVKAFIISLVIYAVISVVAGLVLGVLAKIPLVGFVFSVVGGIIGLYVLVGVVLSILSFVKIIK